MKTVKKSLALAMSAVLASTLLSVSAFAAEGSSVKVSLTGPESVSIGEEYKVTLGVDNTDIGGIQGTITYDATKVEFANKAVVDAVAGANTFGDDGADNAIVASDGTIKFVLLAGDNTANYAEFTFKAKDGAEAQAISLNDVKVSDKDGNKLVDSTKADFSAEVSASKIATQKKSTIRTNSEAKDIRFLNDLETTNITKVGFLYIPSVLLEGKELTLDGRYKNNVKAAKAEITIDDAAKAELAENKEVYFDIDDTSKTVGWLNLEYAVRLYVEKNGKVEYADYTTTDSLVGVLKAIIAENNVEGLDDIVNATERITPAQYKKAIDTLVEKIFNK